MKGGPRKSIDCISSSSRCAVSQLCVMLCRAVLCYAVLRPGAQHPL